MNARPKGSQAGGRAQGNKSKTQKSRTKSAKKSNAGIAPRSDGKLLIFADRVKLLRNA
jgi:hypothetical protein